MFLSYICIEPVLKCILIIIYEEYIILGQEMESIWKVCFGRKTATRRETRILFKGEHDSAVDAQESIHTHARRAISIQWNGLLIQQINDMYKGKGDSGGRSGGGPTCRPLNGYVAYGNIYKNERVNVCERVGEREFIDKVC